MILKMRLGQCEKCGSHIMVPDERVEVGPLEDFGQGLVGTPVLVIQQGRLYYPRHNGEYLQCGFHPNMTYYVYDTGVVVDVEVSDA